MKNPQRNQLPFLYTLLGLMALSLVQSCVSDPGKKSSTTDGATNPGTSPGTTPAPTDGVFFRTMEGVLIKNNGDGTYCTFRNYQGYYNAGGTTEPVLLPIFQNSSGSITFSGHCNVQGRIALNQQIESDITVDDKAKSVLTVRLESAAAKRVFINADGRFYAVIGRPYANVQIYVNGSPVGNKSAVDWRQTYTNALAQHSFNNIALAQLNKGTNTIELWAQDLGRDTKFNIGAGTTLSILESSAKELQSAQLAQDTFPIKNTTGVLNLNHFLALSNRPSLPSAIVLSGNATWSGSLKVPTNHGHYSNEFGDALMGIAVNGDNCPLPANSTWSVNDIWLGAEVRAPMFSQALYAPNAKIPSAVADALPWPSWTDPNAGLNGKDPISFQMAASTTLISLEGPDILAAKFSSPTVRTCADTTYDYLCIGSRSVAQNPDCPATGTEKTLAEAEFFVPEGHDGTIVFLAKTRIQGDTTDAGGIAFLGLEIDGVKLGFRGVQELKKDQALSQRTISASYLSAGDKRLSPGKHRVRVYAQATGDFLHLMVNRDLPLLYFD